MNARFKSLANIWANRRQVEDRLGVVYVFTEEALQVYAEQIVKEYASLCENSGYEFGTIFSKMGKEHFGIKE